MIILGISIFVISLIGLIIERGMKSINIILIIISLELILLSISIILMYISNKYDDMIGINLILGILSIAGAESAIGLSILVNYNKKEEL